MVVFSSALRCIASSTRMVVVASMLGMILGAFGFLGAAAAVAGSGKSDSDESESQSLSNTSADTADTGAQQPASANDEPVETPVAVEASKQSVSPPPAAQEPAPEPVAGNVDQISAPQQDVDVESNDADAIEIAPGQTASVVAGRVATLDIDAADAQNVKILSGLDYGNVTVNPDNTLAVVLTGTTQSDDMTFSVEVTNADGNVQQQDISLDVSDITQGNGWGLGKFYMLEVDTNGDVIVEHGENHREVYVSNSEDALSLSDIAALEGLNVSNITRDWLVKNPEYGSNPDMALDPEAGMELWYEISNKVAGPNSNWLLFERGYEYDLDGRVIANGAQGESELHPQLLTAYGDGSDPVINTLVNVYRDPSENVVVQGLDLTDGAKLLTASNMIFDDISIGGDGATSFSVNTGEGITLRNSDIVDNYHLEPVNGGDTWTASPNRVSSVFISGSDSVLVEGVFVDHTGWQEGYDAINASGDSPQPPSYYSQNFYIQKNNLDVTFRDNISMRSASMGAQIRSGGMIEDNVFIDNNGAVNFFGGWENTNTGVYMGNYTLFTDNVVTSGQHLASATHQGAMTFGVDVAGSLPSLVDNIITHMANPDDPEELASIEVEQKAIKYSSITDETYYDDTIVYNWVGPRETEDPTRVKSVDRNVDDLDEDLLDQTTIQQFTAQLLGQETATIEDLANYLRTQDETGSLDNQVDADLIIDFFQTGFGLTPDLRAEAEEIRFIPNDLADGVRWDNRLNWSSEDLPGTQDGDSVLLGGNWVEYGGTTRLDGLHFGEGGKLNVTHGYLEVEGRLAVGEVGAELNIDNAGQFWTNGYADKDLLDINAAGGRFANTGLFSGTSDLDVSDNAQAILASDDADFLLGAGSRLTLTGDDTRVGFDGDQGGTGVLLMSDLSELNFIAEDNGLSTIREFYSGHYDDDGAGIQSGVNLGMTALTLDLSDTNGAARSHTLIEVDELIGSFGGINVLGLGTDRDAMLEVNYDNDYVSLYLGEAGSGSGVISLETIGDETNAQDDAALWDALTNGHGLYSDDPVEDIPIEEDLLEL